MIKWRIELDEIIRDYPLESGDHKAAIALALLKGSARDKFQQTILILDTDNKDLPKESRKTKPVCPNHSPKILSVRTAVVQTMHQKTVGLVQRTRANLNLVKSLRTKRS